MDRPSLPGIDFPATAQPRPATRPHPGSGSVPPTASGTSDFAEHLGRALAETSISKPAARSNTVASPPSAPSYPERQTGSDTAPLNRTLLNLLRIWAAEHMAVLPGGDTNTVASGGDALGLGLWPFLLQAWGSLQAPPGTSDSDRITVLFAPSNETPSFARPGSTGDAAWESLIDRTAARHGLNPALLRAVMMAESGGNPMARSPAGALGLMQLMPGTARALGVDPLDPAQNLDGGARYLQSLLSRYHGNLAAALAAYNAGPAAVDTYGGIPPYRETQAYVRRVQELYAQYL
ncbi:MAG: lytic transglycosylase domain-containing protein [Kyrpidia sp.]|nr:lytic transglycosylase domain-containing protein [Kyrpidia sp.]